MNLFIADPTGLSKTGRTTKLIDAPSAHIRLDAKSITSEVASGNSCKAIKEGR